MDIDDLDKFCYYWLSEPGSIHNDYFERADIDKDGTVDFKDFVILVSNWLDVIE